MATLDDYALENPPKKKGPQCAGCFLREAAPDIHAELAAGLGRYTHILLAEYATSRGYPMTYNQVRDHFRTHYRRTEER